MAAAQKFEIETHFAPDGTILREPKGKKTHFTEAEVAAEKTAAYEKGRRDETARAQAATAAALAALAEAVRGLHAAYAQETAALREEAAALGFAVGKAVAGAALDRFGEARVRDAIAHAMDGLRGAPRLMIRLPEAQAAQLGGELDQLALEHGFTGVLIVRADPSLSAGDVALDWGEGQIQIDRAAALARAEEILNTALSHAAFEGDQS